MRNDQNYTALKFRGFSYSPETLSNQLDLVPTRSWVKGDEFVWGHGKQQKIKNRDNNFWEFEWRREDGKWIQELIDEFLSEIVSPRKDIIRSIAETCYCEISIAQYLYNGCNPGFHFKRDVLNSIHYIGAELDFDVYCLAETEK